MIDTQKIKEIAEAALEGTELFVVDVTSTPSNEIEVTIDSDDRVDIDDCAGLSRIIEEQFDREEEDFQLTVTSAGIGQPLKLLRQYRNLIGGLVEVVFKNGNKLIAELRDADEGSVTVAYEESVLEEGKKRRRISEVEKTFPLSDIKVTKEYIDFK